MNNSDIHLKGSMIAYGLVIMFMVSIIMTSIIGFVTGQVKYSLRVHAREQAFQIAESGIHFYRWYLAHQVEGRTASQIAAFWATGNPYGVNPNPYEVEYTDPNGGGVGRYKLEVTPPAAGSTVVLIKATGWTYKYPDDKRVIQVRFRRPSWSENAVLANDVMRFGSGTEVYGKIHSNQGIRFDGVAHNIVSSAVSTYDDPDHAGAVEFGVHTHVNVPPAVGVNDTFRAAEAPSNTPAARSDVFTAGRSFPVPTVDFNGVLGDLNTMKSTAQAGANNNRYFANLANDVGRKIILKTNGTYDTCRVAAASLTAPATYDIATTNGYKRPTNNTTCNSCSGQCLQNYTIPDNGIIFVEDNVWLEGQINNKLVTVVAADLNGGAAPSVYIANNLRYTNYTGKDIIGVIGQNDIEIPKTSANDLRIDAALLAQQGRVGRSDYGTADHRNSITIHGAIATNQRYGFAWTNGSQNWGYTTRNLYYDNQLLYFPPPYFPTGTQYEMDLWQEH